jgi:hypothetical protein
VGTGLWQPARLHGEDAVFLLDRPQPARCPDRPYGAGARGPASAGAGFVVVITGEIMTMPGLPKVPSSEKIFLNDQGFIEGLF